MHLLKRIAISNGDKNRKEAATTIILEKNRDKIVNWNKELEDEVWRKIVKTLVARGYPLAEKNLEKRRR